MQSRGDINFLVVDDEEFVLGLAVRFLHKLGYTKVDTAGNGVEALEKLKSTESPYDVIICDLNMPGMNGVEFMRHAKENNYSGGLILLSGADERILEMALDLGRVHKLNVLGYIAKPLTPGVLEELLSSYDD